MAVPRHRHTKSKVHKRRMHIYITPPVLTICQKCKKPVRPHTICRYCGYYKGREFINVLGKLTKKEQKAREKEMNKAEKGEAKNASVNMEELSKK
jgi:large subunit ribosomal protein L32